MTVDLSGYSVTFARNRLFGTWQWVARAPDGRELRPLAPLGFAHRDQAERDAMRAMETDASRETLTGDALRDRVLRRAS